ncbi:MAG: hypothetical protein RL514_1529 [Verrucomicrobiota bacterium]|jgi:hypothetical protein
MLDPDPPYRYQVYGLTLATWVPFPELVPAAADAPVDAVVRLGEVPAALPELKGRGVRYQAAPGVLLAWVDGVARYLTSKGREIIVEPQPGACEADIKALLFCSPMGALLHQRELLPLHASAIATERGAVLFLGPSGRGKSTLAAHFQQRGFPVLADDVAVISFDAHGRAMVAPGPPVFKVWPDSVRALGESVEQLPQLRTGLEKRSLAFGSQRAPAALPLARVYHLDAVQGWRQVKLVTLAPADQLRVLLNNTYRKGYVAGLGRQTAHFQQVGRVLAQAEVRRVSRPDSNIFYLRELADELVADFTR